MEPGTVLVLNGAPRSGKSSIARVVQETFEGVWINLGVDVYMQATPPKLRPGIGLRPGGERPDLEAFVPTMVAALFESAAAHSRLGLNVVMDLGLHDSYSQPLGVLADGVRRLEGLPVLFVGVRCPIEQIVRRRAKETGYLSANPGEPIPEPILRWQRDVHDPGVYDLEVDTSTHSPEECAAKIRELLDSGWVAAPTAMQRLSRPLPPVGEG